MATSTEEPVLGVLSHADAVRHVLASLGLTGIKYDVYRCTVRFLVLHTMIRTAVTVIPDLVADPGASKP